MRKTALMILAYFLCLSVMVIEVKAQEDMMKIDNTVFENPVRRPVKFHHEAHNDSAGIYECNECHHVYKDGIIVEYESSEDKRCSDCHGLKEATDIKLPLMKAFHTNCKGCHLENKTGPMMCGECHIKKGKL